MTDNTTRPPSYHTTKPQRTPAAEPNPWAHGDGPRPHDDADLIKEIKLLAEARRREALTHPFDHQCDACKIRRAA